MKKTAIIQLLLFVATLITTTLSGAESIFGRYFFFIPERFQLGWPEFWQGLWFSVPFLGILTAHEFGHYFVAKYHQIKVTLPYYIPMWLGPFSASFGTLGAFIKIQEQIKSRKIYFDVGIAGPLAGFVVAVGVLWYGFSHLPTLDYIFTIHPEYKKYGMGFARVVYANKNLGGSLLLGDNLLFNFFKTYVADPTRLPPPQEMMHYPFILAGYLSLFFTALNLIPIGQLDGGHVLYGLIGERKFRIVAPVLFFAFVNYAGLGLFNANDFGTAHYASELLNLAIYVLFLQLCFSKISSQPINSWILALTSLALQLLLTVFFPKIEGFSGFLAFAFLLGRVLGVHHPPVDDKEPLTLNRQVLGWISLLIFVLCFSPKPFVIL